ncbi:hypothetical protein NLU13_2346 [Sarocladium strictum]|uniref:NmrA-like domain-containing protein n=1 Tax=Sarocladium strictum TaxID=5046 RepID=A0AA39LD54_SARSR|nr:hypothetical protein NLU13_2346 [Sarocladium strictum]
MTFQKLSVVVVGGSGETGRSIMAALLALPDQFTVTALARPSSVSNSVFQDFAKLGAIVKPADAQDKDALVPVLTGADVVISCIQLYHAATQNPLIEAAHEAGVKRFVPSFWATACPPGGVMQLRDAKEASLNTIKALYLPYTVIDVGWWLQISIPLVPSGKLDSVVTAPAREIVGDGSARTAVTDQVDIGRFVARIIADPRTLNKQVFAYGQVTSQNDIFAAVERHTGETIPRTYLTAEQAEEIIGKAAEAIAANPEDISQVITRAVTEYKVSCGIRGDNEPGRARYLGYLDARELYPDLKTKSVDEFVKELVEGSRTATVYARKAAAAAQKQS